MVEKRRCLFTKYSFEIGVLTLPAHMVILAGGIMFLDSPIGQVASIAGLAGTATAIISLLDGAKEITF